LLGIRHSNGARRTTTENRPGRESCPNEQLPNRVTERGQNVLDLRLCCLHPPNNNLSYCGLAKFIVQTVQFGPAEPFLPSLCCIYREDETAKGADLASLERNKWDSTL